MSNLSIFSEIQRLRAVAVHAPGPEVDYMTPTLMHQLLFDDILFGADARKEHQEFSAVLGKVADVMDVQDLLAQTMEIESGRNHFLQRLAILHKLSEADLEELSAMDSKLLAACAISGWYEPLNDGAEYRFRFPPVPNLLFMRDPAAVIGNGVSINHMATSARAPEPFIMDAIFHYHPYFSVDAERDVWFNAIHSYMKGYPEIHNTIEGGDTLVLSEDIIAVGISIRTSQSAVTVMAEHLRAHSNFKTLFAVLMPEERAIMHLDTIFTQIDEEKCLIFPPLLEPKNPQALPALRMDLSSKSIQVSLNNNFLDALSKEGHHLEPVYCGGKNRLYQEREQWTDGANAFCLAPGVILGYSRNTYTAEELNRVGYNIITADDVLADRYDLLDGKKYFILIRGNELSRARGGPRCMTMPLRRDH